MKAKEKARKREQTNTKRKQNQEDAKQWRRALIETGHPQPSKVLQSTSEVPPQVPPTHTIQMPAEVPLTHNVHGPDRSTSSKNKSKSRQDGDARQQKKRDDRQSAATAARERKRLKLGLMSVKQVNKADRRGKGTARAHRLQKHIAKMAAACAIDGPKGAQTGSGNVSEPLCKYYLTSDDMLLVAASANLPQGVSQILRSCSRGPTCTHKHSDGGSALNRAGFIAKRKRLLVLSQAPVPASPATHTSITGRLKEFDFCTGCGFITPHKLVKGATARRQRDFFHRSAWKCALPFPADVPRAGIPV